MIAYKLVRWGMYFAVLAAAVILMPGGIGDELLEEAEDKGFVDGRLSALWGPKARGVTPDAGEASK